MIDTFSMVRGTNLRLVFCIFQQETIDAIEALIKKHEAFERSAMTQEERFAALERLTTVSSMIAFETMCLLRNLKAEPNL